MKKLLIFSIIFALSTSCSVLKHYSNEGTVIAKVNTPNKKMVYVCFQSKWTSVCNWYEVNQSYELGDKLKLQ